MEATDDSIVFVSGCPLHDSGKKYITYLQIFSQLMYSKSIQQTMFDFSQRSAHRFSIRAHSSRFDLTKTLVLTALMLAGYCTCSAQNIHQSFAGQWWLAILEEASLPLNLTFGNDSNSTLRPFFYSPMQSDEPLGVSTWSFRDDTLRYTDKQSGVRMTLAWDPHSDTFRGTFRQGMLRTTLAFKPSDGIFQLIRPQTPQPPYPYGQREVTIERRKANVTLVGTLTIPSGNRPKNGWPAVLLVSGSGQQNRDEELMGHKPFAVLADHLTRQGIAVLRYDDRGVGQSKGDYTNATTLDFADDAEAVFDFLRKQKEVDSRRIGIIGHSEGGMIAPIVASRNKRVAFIVMLAGPGTTGRDILLQQNVRILALSGMDDNLAQLHVEAVRQVMDALDTVPTERYEAYCKTVFSSLSEGLTAEQRKEAGLRNGDAIAIANQLSYPWMHAFIKLDNSQYLKKVRCPILAINGSLDCQVLPENLDAIMKVSNGKTETFLFPSLNHLLQHCATGSPNEYMQIEETISSDVLELLTQWILKQ